MRIIILCFMLALAGSLVNAAATAKQITDDKGRVLLRLENPYLQLDFDPQLGARGVTLIDKATGKDWLFGQESREGSGLFMDHFWEQNWPGEFLFTPYQAEIVPTADGSACVRFRVTSTGKWGQTPLPLLSGIELTRTVTLLPDIPVIQVTVQLHNPTAESRVAGYWMQNALWAGGDRENDRYLRPSPRGTSRVGWDWKTKSPIVGFMESDFERAPTAGWTAVTDERQRKTMVFVMDYGPLFFLYNCLQNTTVEWQYVQQAIPPGKTWETHVTAALVNGYPGLVHATQEALFDTEFAVKPNTLAITLLASRLNRPITSVKFDLIALKLQSRKEVALPAIAMQNLELAPSRATVQMPGPFKEQIALKVDAVLTFADGETKREHFETFFGGNLGFAGINRTIDIPPMYPIPPQPKQLIFLKPERIARDRQAIPRVLVLNGQFSEAWQAAKGAAALPGEVKTGESFASSAIASAVTYWPVDYGELMKYDAIVLANLDLEALGVLGQEMLRDYLLHGGGLVVLGGINTLGNGHFAGSRIADLLPVEPGKPFEMLQAKAKTLTTSEPSFAGLQGKGIQFIHRLVLRANAKVVARAGDVPVLVLGEAGEGRIAILGATTLGKPAGALWEDAGWTNTLAEIIRWAAKR